MLKEGIPEKSIYLFAHLSVTLHNIHYAQLMECNPRDKYGKSALKNPLSNKTVFRKALDANEYSIRTPALSYLLSFPAALTFPAV